MTAETVTAGTVTAQTPRTQHPVRPFYWSLRRELWENRAPVIAPLAVAALMLAGFVVSLSGLADGVRNLTIHGMNVEMSPLSLPYSIAALALVATGQVVAAFYALGALHGERRDRSLLFWKSLPVSDLTTVAAKAVIPLVLIPAFVLVVATALLLAMLALGSLVLAANGLEVGLLTADVALGAKLLDLAWGLAALSLWLAPVFCWFLMVSGWARKSPFLWAVLPPIVLSVVERMAFHTSYVGDLIKTRLGGGFAAAFGAGPMGATTIDPAGFFADPQTWGGDHRRGRPVLRHRAHAPSPRTRLTNTTAPARDATRGRLFELCV